MPILATLCYIIKDGRILMLKKERGIGLGKINGPGGRFERNETPEDCAVREVFEETGLKVSNIKNHGILNFFFGQRYEPNWIVHVFSTESFEGELKSSDEGKLVWYDINNIPFDEMWEDDKHWLPFMLQGKKFKCDFYYDEKMGEILDYVINLES